MNTADKELLELAAKAAGHDVRRELMDNGEPFFIGQSKEHAWNPLTYDGDALRLAVLLRLDLNINDGECDVFSSDGLVNERGEDTGSATRRAITRAAAEIGGVWHDLADRADPGAGRSAFRRLDLLPARCAA